MSKFANCVTENHNGFETTPTLGTTKIEVAFKNTYTITEDNRKKFQHHFIRYYEKQIEWQIYF